MTRPAASFRIAESDTRIEDIAQVSSRFRPASCDVVNGAEIDYWIDDFQGYMSVVKGTTGPTYHENVLNGHPVIRFPGVNIDRHLQTSRPMTIQCACGVIKFDDEPATTGDQAIFGGLTSGVGVWLDAPGTTFFNLGGQTFYIDDEQSTSSNDLVTPTEWHLFICNYATPQSFVGLQIDRDRANSNKYFQGDMAELITFETALSEANRNLVVDYVSKKYGIF